MTRDELYQRFSPELVEAIVLVIKDEVNLLRNQHGLPERTNQNVINAIGNKLSSIPKYSWDIRR